MLWLQAFLLSWHPKSPTSGVGTAPCAPQEALGAASRATPHQAPRTAFSLATPSPTLLLVGDARPRPALLGIKALVAPVPARAYLPTSFAQSGTCSASLSPLRPPVRHHPLHDVLSRARNHVPHPVHLPQHLPGEVRESFIVAVRTTKSRIHQPSALGNGDSGAELAVPERPQSVKTYQGIAQVLLWWPRT